MPQIAIRLTDDELAGLDRLVAERHFASRAAAIRDALAQVQKAEEDRRIAEAYDRAYGNRPPTQEEIDLGETGLALLAEFYAERDEPPWSDENLEQSAQSQELATSSPPPRSRLEEIESVAAQLFELVHSAAEQERQAP